ncbi:hypothetical protein SAMN05428989_2726 [Pseudoxanthomonas sp. GM95]|uniref:hypothetical protein n=1 Tax=Pseudoxanthomonas sp. GM95 TaxID=1881043 RepID=UPI0008CBCD69|nr:hypothetical protein [Pseudoxanthomonas sp. GM95]SEL86515.1 hypothetical protein SAMN05428989_2726 [Pseudoxanthomonas sp. GM95]
MQHMGDQALDYAPPQARVADDWRWRAPRPHRRFWLTCLASVLLMPPLAMMIGFSPDAPGLSAAFLVVCWALPTAWYLWPEVSEGQLGNGRVLMASFKLVAGTLCLAMALLFVALVGSLLSLQLETYL